ncbi:MAG TPA: PAS domain-containing protein, partial [Flavobacterium sp.]
DGWISWYNQRWYDYTGTTFEEMEGWGWKKMHHPDLIDDMMVRFKNALTTGQPWEDTFLLRGKNGEYRWFLSRALPIRNSENKIVQWFGTNTDISDQHQIEEELKLAKEQLENTFKNIPTAVYHFDHVGNIIFLNQQAATLMGYDSIEDVLAEKDIYNFRKKLDEKFIITDDSGKILPVDESASAITFRTGKAAEVAAHFIDIKSGHSFYILSKSTPIYDSGGNLQMVLTTSTDITKQKEAEHSISYRTALLEAHNWASLDGILIVDAKGKIVSWNNRFVEIWNMPKSIVDAKDDNAALEHAMKQLTDPETFISGVKESYENPDTPRIDFLEFLDGRTIERLGYPVTSENGQYYAWSWAFRDVTSQRNYEKTIRESEASYRDLAASLEEKVNERTHTLSQLNETYQYAEEIGNFGSYRYDFEKQHLSYSDNLYKLLGCQPKEFPACPEAFIKFIHPEDRDLVLKATTDAFDRQEISKWEYRVVRKDGKTVHVRGSGSIIIDEDGKKYMIGTLQDITEEKKREQQLKENNEALVNMNKELESFAYISSHDLQEPLRKIQTFASRIIEDESQNITEKGRDHFQKIQNAALRMQTLIDDLLVYSRTTTEDRKFEKTSLIELIEEIKEELKEDLDIYQATIYVGKMTELRLIPFQFRQLMHNLIGNSLKFSKRTERPRIEISSKIVTGLESRESKLQEAEKYCHITVTDNGIGFEPEYGDKIFEVFQRLHGRDKYNGTGIGLAIVKKIVDNHNGVIKATGMP